MDVVEVVPAFEQYAFTFGGVPPVRRVVPGTALRLWSDDAFCGARAVLVGRAYLYGLMAGGERGVQRVADILTGEVARTMQLVGVASVAELTPDRVRLRA